MRPRSKEKYIYIISNARNELKIGITNDIERRKREIQTSNSEGIAIEHYELREFPSQIETKLHRRFQKNRMSGEWFGGLTVHDIRKALMVTLPE